MTLQFKKSLNNGLNFSFATVITILFNVLSILVAVLEFMRNNQKLELETN